MERGGRFLSVMKQGPILVLDAGMGTRLYTLGLNFQNDDASLWNLSRPEIVLDIHRRDVDAGADVLFTNTFSANCATLEPLGRSSDLATILETGAALAREAAGPNRFVLGSIGPGSEGVEYAEIAAVLIASGVDGLILETHRFDQAERALGTLHVDVPVIVSLYEWPENGGDSARRLIALGASALGANCGTDPRSVIQATETIAPGLAVPWLAKPSAGIPGGPITTPAEYAEIARQLRDLGATMIGGCCGTTEAHVTAIRSALFDLI